MNRHDFGRQGENLAFNFLKQKGYEILETNFRKRVGEVDIIARSPGGEIVFAEVKTRHGHAYGYPEEAVDRRKLHKIVMAAQLWLAKKHLAADRYRVDVIAIEWKGGQPEIIHLKNIS